MAKFEAACSCRSRPGSRDGTCRLSPRWISPLCIQSGTAAYGAIPVWNYSLWDSAKHLYVLRSSLLSSPPLKSPHRQTEGYCNLINQHQNEWLHQVKG